MKTALHVLKAAQRRPDILERVKGVTDWPVEREVLVSSLYHVPDPLHAPVLEAWKRRFTTGDYRGANIDVIEFARLMWSGGLTFAASDAEIEALAGRKVREVRGYIGDLGATDADALRRRLEQFARHAGIPAPQVKSLRGLVGRMSDEKWWRRALRRGLVRALEAHSIRLGMVHKRASLYASREAIDRRAAQKKRNARTLSMLRAENESGEGFALSEIASHSVANPAIRRAELMTRISGFEDFARARGDVAMFYTMTCPSRMHARLALSGDQNPKYDGTSPRAAQEYLRRTWAKQRAALARARAWVYGFRVAEPHHDGTPHWHLLLFMRADYAAGVTKILEKYARAADASELQSEKAREARFHVKEIDWNRGSAAGYIAKYIAKNIDGFAVGEDFEAAGDEGGRPDARGTVSSVDAWAATWGIRQFQQVGGPGVTIWRELRRLRAPQSLPLFDDLRECADVGQWRDYVAGMGGIEIRRRDRTLNLWRVDYSKENRYGEDAPAAIEGVQHFAVDRMRTRMHEWRLTNDAGKTGSYRNSGAKRAAREHQCGGRAVLGGDGAESAIGRGRFDAAGLDARAANEPASGILAEGWRGNADAEGLGGRVGSAFDVPWTGVNNCTPVDKSATCAPDSAWLEAYEQASRDDRHGRAPP